MSIAIKAENLSKAYQLGDFGTGTISRDLERYWARLRGKEDPFLKIGETNDRTRKGTNDVVWSLRDIAFEIEQGDAVGIIGRNGAGKSTLLKILSRVTSPTTGSVKVKGRIASLLEVGTGFHPELTGRENIFLNGAILGMRKGEIKRKFDEIVAFAGIDRYVDTPVKRYSSGMYVRLAFAVAAHLESEILIVDEVLAVGDADFQKKCLGKMQDVSKGEGRTVLFVSHNMGSIKSLCNTGMVLNNGLLQSIEPVSNAIGTYNQLLNRTDNITRILNGNLKDQLLFHKIWINNSADDHAVISIAQPLCFNIEGEAVIDFNRVVFVLAVYHAGVRLFTLREVAAGRALSGGKFTAAFNIKPGFLRPGEYTIALGAWGDTDNDWVWGTEIGMFTISAIWDNHIRQADEGIINAEFIRLNE
ncbi:polysaccharide ABC transporter ATP-binding protein [Mucilaginibacter sp.]|uniref:ABC transporter ATP-binding protein n=1 Tax=Mucilaginibacter sp. TaxID=1882438 RepID=UPI0025E3FF0D|nr:polysaccharide ABC transporter ATP-binding protein [Mucilaginibacter sp.]